MSISSQIHTLITAAVSAADAGHSDDAAVLLQEALDHDFLAEIAMALHAVEAARGTGQAVDLRPHLGEIVTLPVRDPAPPPRRRAITGDQDDDAFDFFGSELIVDMDDPVSNARIVTPDFDQPADRRPSSALRKTIEATEPSPPEAAERPEPTVPEMSQTPSADDPFARLVDDLAESSAFSTRPPAAFSPVGFAPDDSFEELDDLDALQDLDDFDDSALAASSSQFDAPGVQDSAPGIDVPSDDSLLDVSPPERAPFMAEAVAAEPARDESFAASNDVGGRGEVTRARYAAVAPAPPPPTHRRSSTHRLSDSHEVSSQDTASGPPVSGPPAVPRGTTESNPIVMHTQEHQDDDGFDDFDLFGDGPSTERHSAAGVVGSPADTETVDDSPPRVSLRTMSGMPQTFKTSPLSAVPEPSSVLAESAPEPPAVTADPEPRPAISTPVRPLVSPVSPERAPADREGGFERGSSGVFSQRPHSHVRSTGESPERHGRRELHGAGTYSATGISESTDGRKHPKFRLLMATVLRKRPLTREQRHQLNPRSMFLLDQVDGSVSVEDLIDISGLHAAEAMEILELLLHDGMVEVV